MGTKNSTVAESGEYIVTLYRLGDTTKAASVELRSIDLSATYGEDYKMVGVAVDVVGRDGTILQQSVKNQGSLTGAQAAAAAAAAAFSGGETGQSLLARERADQTGIPSRPVTAEAVDGAAKDFIQDLVSSLGIDIGNQLPASSIAYIEFAPYESKKEVTFAVLGDRKPEGQEMFSLLLATPGENLIVAEPRHCTIVIADDEPTEHPKLSFSAKTFSAKDGVATVKVKRKGADYAAATAMMKTLENGSARDGVHYNAQDTPLEFLPYEMEKTVEIAMHSSEAVDFEVELYDIKGAEPGRRTVSTVAYRPSQNRGAQNEAALQGANYREFGIKLDKDYTVVQEKKEDTVVKIVDRDYTPEVTVGEYFFPNDAKNGGTFRYGSFKGDSNCFVNRNSEYNAEKGYGYLRWYGTSTWDEGEAACFSMADGKYHIGADRYQYVSAHWEMDGGFSGNETRVEMDWPSGSGLPINAVVDGAKEIPKRMSTGVHLLSNNLPISSVKGRVKFLVIDNELGQTPNMKLYLYGMAAMYRKFKINLNQPKELSYRISETQTMNMPPATVQLGEGHETRYFGQDLQIQVFSATEGEPIKGKLTGYKITVGENAEKKQTFTYIPKGDMKNIAIDEEFIRLVDKNTKEVQKQGSYGFTTTLTVEPIFDYKSVTVNSIASPDGSFTDSAISKPGTKTMHIGDCLDMGGKTAATGLYYQGYERKIYANASDTVPLDSGLMEDLGGLLLREARYDLKPVFGDEINHIEVLLVGEAKDKVRLPGLVADAELPDNLKGRKIIAVDPKPGKIYTIQAFIDDPAAAGGKIWRPVFTMSDSNEKVQGHVLDFIANGRAADNVIRIDLESVSRMLMPISN